jgi:hypothetical protein
VTPVARLALAALVVGVVSGCGYHTGTDAQAPQAVPRPTAIPAAPGLVTTTTARMVMEDGSGGAGLCLYATDATMQCDLIPIAGWDWAEHPPTDEFGGVRLGFYAVTGEFDGTTIRPTEILSADEAPEREFDTTSLDRLLSPCPEPEGGWRVLDPARTTERTKHLAIEAAMTMDGFAGAWGDQSINPAFALDDNDPAKELAMNDPLLQVLNVRLTRDVAAAGQELREIWGGALCVSRARYSDAELEPIQRAVGRLPGNAGTGRGHDIVDAYIIYDDGSIQAWADQEYGAGVVVLEPSLTDVEP